MLSASLKEFWGFNDSDSTEGVQMSICENDYPFMDQTGNACKDLSIYIWILLQIKGTCTPQPANDSEIKAQLVPGWVDGGSLPNGQQVIISKHATFVACLLSSLRVRTFLRAWDLHSV